MTSKEIIDKIIINYNLDIKDKTVLSKLDDLGKYISARVKKEHIDELYFKIIENFTPTTMNPFPWIDTISKYNKISDTILEQNAIRMYDLLEMKSDIYKDLVVEDSAIQAGLERIGGWQEFCNRLISENDWKRKQFVKAHVESKKDDYKCDIKVYRGQASNGKKIMIGDETVIKQYLENDNKKYLEQFPIFDKFINN